MYPCVHRSSFRYGVPSVLLYLRDQAHKVEMSGCCAIHTANNTSRLLPIITGCEGFHRRVLRTFFSPFNVVAVAYFNNGAKVALSSSLLSHRISDNTTPRTEHGLILLSWSSFACIRLLFLVSNAKM